MKRKINLLIGFSSVVLIVLIAMQYYLVQTSYHYKIEQFHAEVKEKVSNSLNDFTNVDSQYNKDFYYSELLDEYAEKKKSKEIFKKKFFNTPYCSVLTQELKKIIRHEFPKNEIDFTVVINKIVILNSSKKADTLFSEKNNIKNAVFGNLTTLKNTFSVKNYVRTIPGISNADFKLVTEETLLVSVKNWEQIILRRMASILILATLLTAILVVLFVITLRTLIRQKKISDIKTDFVNNITHELKTPLTTLSVSTKILERKDILANDEALNSVLATINRQNNRLQNIVDQVMNNSLGFEEIALRKEKIKADTLLNSVIFDFNLMHPNIKINLKISNPEVNLVLDKFHLTTAINNVLDNAVKYGCHNITLKTFSENNFFYIQIEDDGIGIPKNKQSLLFEKFYRIENGNIHNVKGLGLGLFYVDQIIKAHKGSVKVISELGKGASFIISVPSI
ncbi:sensor histidine kinase [Flavobacterium sediminis]|uniref:histidine kinase n=1 Tax=Flavobacterium sediminis TaxID=2201181 RepID=A0A2U8QYT4_9FLAO|nr:HAMP domain-containing sensor histidine kinase [Flavobacterium sediminis]AWM15076.1 sensor histidine kinase [Flavobacterium sediminis]